MTSYNSNSSYSRTYEKKVIEEAPRERIASTLSSSIPPEIRDHFSTHFSPTQLGGPIGNAFGGGGATSSAFQSIRTTDNSISVTMDVREFKPEDLKISVIGQFIIVEAKHGEKKDELGTIERHFIRKIPLPHGVQPDAVTSNLAADGALTIVALPPKPKESSPARAIPIKVQVSPANN